MQNTYTKGKWFVEGGLPFGFAISVDGIQLGKFTSLEGTSAEGDEESNARLASAAPELLEAAKASCLLISEKYQTKDDLWAICSQLFAAISKAEGIKL